MTLVLGKISDDPAGTIVDWKPLADYLASGLEDFGVASVKVKIAPDHPTMANWLATEQVDIFFDNPLSAAYAMRRSQARFFLTRVKTGAAEKRGVFFTSTDSGIESLQDLKGRMIGLEEPDSASGFVVPVAHLMEKGLDPVEKRSGEAEVGTGEVGYVFTNDDDNTLFWVLTGRLVAGVVDDQDFETFRRANPGELIALGETEPITRNQPGLVGPRVDDELLEALRRLFMDLAESSRNADGERILPNETRRFAELSPEDEAAVNRVGAWMRQIAER